MSNIISCFSRVSLVLWYRYTVLSFIFLHMNSGKYWENDAGPLVKALLFHSTPQEIVHFREFLLLEILI